MSKLKLLVATNNSGKIQEIRDLFAPRYIEVLDLSDFPGFTDITIDEKGETFIENAVLKARTYGRLSGILTLGDDSGLSVDALDGRPGVLSKRYGDSDSSRITKLLNELKQIPPDARQAHFTSAMVIYDPSADKNYVAEGQVNGQITVAPKGHHGFGYDPIFFCPEIGKTFGEATREEKNLVSHRARALVQISTLLRKHFT